MIEFATLLGYDRKAVQRWEADEVAVPTAAMALAVLLGQGDRGALRVLRDEGDDSEKPSTVRVDAA